MADSFSQIPRIKNDTNYDNIYNTNEQRVDMTMMLDILCLARWYRVRCKHRVSLFQKRKLSFSGTQHIFSCRPPLSLSLTLLLDFSRFARNKWERMKKRASNIIWNCGDCLPFCHMQTHSIKRFLSVIIISTASHMAILHITVCSLYRYCCCI